MAKYERSESDVISMLNGPVFESKQDGLPITPADDDTVTLDQLKPYDNNPRKTRNPKYDEIKESIRNRGLDQPPKITRRHATDTHFMVKDGGNTRLEILNELWKETGDARFYRIKCTYEPWESEIDALAGHMAENEARGPLLFIEKALAVAKFRTLFEDGGEGAPLSGRDLAKRINATGWTIDSSTLSRYEYAVRTLLPVLPATLWAGAGRPLITKLRQIESSYQKYWRKHQPADLDLFEAVWSTILSDFDSDSIELDVESIRKTMDIRIGEALGIDYQTVAVECDALATRANLDLIHTDRPNVAPPLHQNGTERNIGPVVVPEPPPPKGPPLQPKGESSAPAKAQLTLAELRQHCFESAHDVAESQGFGSLVVPVPFGFGFKVDLPFNTFETADSQGNADVDVYVQLVKIAISGAWLTGNTDDVLPLEKALVALPGDGLHTFAICELNWTYHVATLCEKDNPFGLIRKRIRHLEDVAGQIAMRHHDEKPIQ